MSISRCLWILAYTLGCNFGVYKYVGVAVWFGECIFVC